jgi:PAS domain S-box-containing protein
VSDRDGHVDLPAEAYRQICQTAAAALIAADRDGRITCWNQAAADLLGSSAAETIGQPLTSIVPEHLQDEFTEVLNSTLNDGEVHQLELLAGSPGQIRDTSILATIGPLGDEQGQTIGVSAWMVDQTRPYLMRAQLAKNERLASLGTLAGGVAHHFNNILGGVSTFVDYAILSGDEVVMRRGLQMTLDAIGRASKLTSALLNFAEQDDPKQDLGDLTEALFTFAHTADPPLKERNIELKVDVAPMPVIAVNISRFYHLLHRLLANAQESIADGGVIDLSARCEGPEIILTMADSGCGIDMDALPRACEPFFTTKGVLGGGHDDMHIGLGLSVAHAIVNDMGGQLEISSELGRGTTVEIRFPLPASTDEALL